jgi:hypothetical protein
MILFIAKANNKTLLFENYAYKVYLFEPFENTYKKDD